MDLREAPDRRSWVFFLALDGNPLATCGPRDVARGHPLMRWNPVHIFSCSLQCYFISSMRLHGLDARGSASNGRSRPAPRRLLVSYAEGLPGISSSRTSPRRIRVGRLQSRVADVLSDHCRGLLWWLRGHGAGPSFHYRLPAWITQGCWLDFVARVPHGCGGPTRFSVGRLHHMCCGVGCGCCAAWWARLCCTGLLVSPCRRWARRGFSWHPQVNSPICLAEAERCSPPKDGISLCLKDLEFWKEVASGLLLARSQVLCKTERTPTQAFAMFESFIPCSC